MKERPILFSAPMVQALLEGRKTQTRRICKGQRELSNIHDFQLDRCPYGQPGDRLWVREGFKRIASGEVKNGYGEVRYGVAYKADGATIWAPRTTIIHDLSGQRDTGPMQFQPRPWKSSIHMPRIASRIMLEITAVRVERLQDISIQDAQAEGVGIQCDSPMAIMEYSLLWESISGAASWNANPWVWAVEFKRIEL